MTATPQTQTLEHVPDIASRETSAPIPMLPTNTHILFHEFEYHEPTTPTEALSLLAEYGDDARPMAGGTDLLVQIKMERRQPKHVVSLNKVPELKRLETGDSDGLQIGSAVSIRTLYKSLVSSLQYSALTEACNWFSTVQIMYMATLGGNLCNASPAADSAPALLVFDAQVEIASARATRTIPLTDLILAPGKTVLQPDELLTKVILPIPPVPTGSAFIKVARVVADISKVCAAVRITSDGDFVKECHIALGSVAPTPLRARKAEAALQGQAFSVELAEHAGAIAASEVAPITDVRSTRDYRQQVAAVIVRDALMRAWQRTMVNPEQS